MARGFVNDGLVESGEPVSAINVTSLVDVMFCLLIMFMIATPLMSPEGKEVTLPAARGETISEEEFMTSVVSIDAAGNVFLGTLPLSKDPERLAEELAKNAKLSDAGVVFLQADQTVPFDRVVDVLVALKKAEIGEVGFVTDPNPKRLEAMRAGKELP
ncbi:MAG: biopolymer transporter ExbD [Deltaproteobacteria bacterium]|nr:MAG: biopolymer transporter ExbD [Deltaproteobacteria bacterium]